ncbi:unnamed protein product [Protopolystoma xenopodis]|uniref:Uncharacterized protein n=1 Tax=Protopolystoma xenopodis TaxID=117903 RepID=A0A448X595_9PLAT|nr:unnamed protein product [Protopolystoma xenopodis]
MPNSEFVGLRCQQHSPPASLQLSPALVHTGLTQLQVVSVGSITASSSPSNQANQTRHLGQPASIPLLMMMSSTLQPSPGGAGPAANVGTTGGGSGASCTGSLPGGYGSGCGSSSPPPPPPPLPPPPPPPPPPLISSSSASSPSKHQMPFIGHGRSSGGCSKGPLVCLVGFDSDAAGVGEPAAGGRLASRLGSATGRNEDEDSIPEGLASIAEGEVIRNKGARGEEMAIKACRKK